MKKLKYWFLMYVLRKKNFKDYRLREIDTVGIETITLGYEIINPKTNKVVYRNVSIIDHTTHLSIYDNHYCKFFPKNL